MPRHFFLPPPSAPVTSRNRTLKCRRSRSRSFNPEREKKVSRDFKRLGRSRSKLHVKIDQEFFCLFAAERAEGENEKRREREERREERKKRELCASLMARRTHRRGCYEERESRKGNWPCNGCRSARDTRERARGRAPPTNALKSARYRPFPWLSLVMRVLRERVAIRRCMLIKFFVSKAGLRRGRKNPSRPKGKRRPSFPLSLFSLSVCETD